MTDLNLTPEEWEALDETLASERELDPDNYIATALDKVLAHRPKSVLQDGWYLTPGACTVVVRDGRWRYANAVEEHPLASRADLAGLTRLRVLADDEVAVKRDYVAASARFLQGLSHVSLAEILQEALEEESKEKA